MKSPKYEKFYCYSCNKYQSRCKCSPEEQNLEEVNMAIKNPTELTDEAINRECKDFIDIEEQIREIKTLISAFESFKEILKNKKLSTCITRLKEKLK